MRYRVKNPLKSIQNQGVGGGVNEELARWQVHFRQGQVPGCPRGWRVRDGQEQSRMPGRLPCGMHEKVSLGLSAPLGCRSFNGLQMI